VSPLVALMLTVVGLALCLATSAVVADWLGLWNRRDEGLTNDWVGAIVIGTFAFAGAVLLAHWIPPAVDSSIPLYLGVGFLMAGSGLFVWALANLRGYRRLRTAAGPNAIHAGPGRVAVSGTVEPTDAGSVTGPFSLADAVCVEARITEDSPDARNGTDLVHEASTRLPFSLVDATGRLRVDPTGADLRVDYDVWAKIRPGDEIPEVLQRYLDGHGLPRVGEPDGSLTHRVVGPSDERTYAEKNLAVGDDVVVLGRARRVDGELVVDGGDPFVVKEGTFEETLGSYRRVVLQGGPAGVVLLLLGAVAMGVVM
jgi:hypothetical protein